MRTLLSIGCLVCLVSSATPPQPTMAVYQEPGHILVTGNTISNAVTLEAMFPFPSAVTNLNALVKP